MITVVGNSNSSEYQAALDLRSLILRSWGTLLDNHKDHIVIISGAKLHGQRRRDLDIVVLARFESNIQIRPFLRFINPDDEDQLELPDDVVIQNFCTIIEVKDHSTDRIRFEGPNVEVSYRNPMSQIHWESATQQNEDQMHALRAYLKMHEIQSPYITHLIWMRNVPNAALPKRPHNILGGDATWDLFMNVINQNARPRQSRGIWRLNSNVGEPESIKNIADLLTKQIIPSGLDRQRMERINQRIVDEQRLYEMVGQRLLILRGRGGTGKTVRLLQLAKYLYDEQAARVLILTYNRALVADLRRLLTIMGIADNIAERSIAIQTAHSYFYELMRGLGVVSEGEEDFLLRYEAFKTETLDMLEVGAIAKTDVEDLKSKSKSTFTWDFIFVDEGQDWPEDERAILFRLYQYQCFAIADGVDQLIRSQTPVDWRGSLLHEQVKIVPLKKCLRMKAGLTRFISTLAGELGLPTNEWMANEEIPGGKVIILEGKAVIENRALFDSLVAANQHAGNEPVDMLFCVPPSMVNEENSESARIEPQLSVVANAFQQWNMKIWDGASSLARSTYPTEVDQLRIVQYDSCRGLEGWSVFLFRLDEFHTYKLNQLRAGMQDEGKVRVQAARWLMIPLTRAMDTLVIHIADTSSALYFALRASALAHPEFIEWRKLDQ